jgi:hypothetical protein
MAARNFSAGQFTPTATGDATNLANGTYMAIQGGSGTQRINVLEVLITGESNSNSPTFLQLAHDSQVAVGMTALAAPYSEGPQDPATAALAAVPQSSVAQGTTAPQRSNATTLSRLRFSFNAFGGIVKWNPWQQNMSFTILGNTASNGEASLSAFTGGTVGQISAHIIYEPL